MFPFLPFAFVPPGPFRAPFAGPFSAFFPFARPRDDSPGDEAAAPFGGNPAQTMMSLAMMPFAAPMALPLVLGTQMAQAVRDAGKVAREMHEALERDEGPVHVTIGDPQTPGGLAIGITLYRRGAEPQLREVHEVGPRALTGPDVRDASDGEPSAGA